MHGMGTNLYTHCTNGKMAKKITEYALVLVDMDGTLYFQRPLQIRMGCGMVVSALTQKGGFSELLTVLRFRRMRENFAEQGNVDEKLYERLAKKQKKPQEQVEQIIRKWIYERPISHIPSFRDKRLIQIMAQLKASEIPVVIWSDYPTDDKKKALGMAAFPGCYNGQEEIGSLKPSPTGILYLMEKYGIKDAGKVLVIGDRMSKDGNAAMAAQTDFVILKKNPWQRSRQYKKLL